MPEKWKNPTKQILLHWTVESLKSKKLNDWERNFCENIKQQLESGRTLTQTQVEKLESVYAERT